MSTLVVVVTLLSLAAGVVNQLVQTGKLFGQWQAPATWGPYLVVLGSFLGGAYTSLQGTTALTAASIFAAVVAGLQSLLVASTPALIVHHFGGQVNRQRPPAMPAPAAAPTQGNGT